MKEFFFTSPCFCDNIIYLPFAYLRDLGAYFQKVMHLLMKYFVINISE